MPLPKVPEAGVRQMAAGLANCLRWNVQPKTLAHLLLADPRLDPKFLDVGAAGVLEMFRADAEASSALAPYEEKLAPYLDEVFREMKAAAQ